MKTIFAIATLFVLTAVGCTPDPKSGKGFTLPDGDVQRGQQIFMQLHCQACHTVSGVKFDALANSPEQKMVALGGEKTRVETYGELVTSIINPSHQFAKGYPIDDIQADGESKMRKYNDEMTVQQLIDLVTFLESHYSVKKYEPSEYPPYY